MAAEDDFDSVWDRMTDSTDAETQAPAPGPGPEIDLGPPIRVTMVIRAAAVPVAPWAQGWRIGALEPHDGHVTLMFEHEISDSPVAQLAAVTGLLGTVKAARLDIAWWLIHARGPLDDEQGEPADFDSEFAELLEREQPSDGV